MNQTGRKTCIRCIMDTSDPEISFDETGICSHCRRYVAIINDPVYRNRRKPNALNDLLDKIKRHGAGRSYDCLIGLSGGVDSTYTAYLVKKMGLRPLAVHLDNGWDSELAVKNIENVLNKMKIDLFSYVLDWETFKDIQLAFLKASTPDAEIPTDHAILAVLYQTAIQYKIRYILSGHNTATEGGGVAAWSQGHGDWRYVHSIHQKYGQVLASKFPHYGPLKYFYYTIMRGIKWVQILDYIDYDKNRAMETIQSELGWKYYGGKHYESIYTRFYQGYILPKKFGFDKKRLHLSMLIWSGQISREAALREMDNCDYPPELQEEDKNYVIKKLGISPDELNRIMTLPPKTFWDFPSYKRIFSRYRWLINIYHRVQRI